MVSIDEPAVQTFVLYSSVLAIKLLLVVVLIAKQRYTRTKKIFANEEDVRGGGVVKHDDPDVERARRAHLNDLENIPAFYVLGALYLTTNPSTAVASWLFRLFTGGRLLHTYFYAIKPRQPARAISFGLTNIINWYMGIVVVKHYLYAL